ncbi:hypothetical protein [Ottowia sp.]|uniref:hypothetical protein n=1 Tax=Ottowia sp. TaxID=1898956 RepID=UPI003A8B2FE9
MMRAKIRTCCVTWAVLMPMVLSACGGDGSEEGVTVVPTPTPAVGAIPNDFDSDAHMAVRAALPTASTVSALAVASNRCETGAFPAFQVWPTAQLSSPAQPAASGTPLIRQIRDGQVIATYDSLGKSGCYQPENNDASPDPSCGVFSRDFGRNWREGDVFEIYPAVYEGEDQQPWIGPAYSTHAQYNTREPTVPRNITLRGITVDGKRPVIRLSASGASNNTLGQGLVYVDESSGITLENLDIDGGTAGSVGKAGVYVRAGENLTLRNVRVSGFGRVDANGIFVAGDASGVLRLDGLELSGNGGDSGPEHNIYVNASHVDDNFTVWMTGSYSHDVYYGHTFKSRAQVNLLEGNYFQGGVGGSRQAEAYLVDLPEGGRALLRNNLLIKNASGDNSNGALVTYAVEGAPAGRTQSLVIEHNTFMAYAKTYDGQHLIYPIFTRYQSDDGTSTWPFAKVAVQNNVFVGFCGTQGRAVYRGDAAWTLDFDDLNAGFSPFVKTMQGNAQTVGRPSYVHQSSSQQRQTALAGAFD